MFKNLTLAASRTLAVCTLATALLTIALNSNLTAADQPSASNLPPVAVEAVADPAAAEQGIATQRSKCSARKQAYMSLALLMPHKKVVPRDWTSTQKVDDDDEGCLQYLSRCRRHEDCCDQYCAPLGGFGTTPVCQLR